MKRTRKLINILVLILVFTTLTLVSCKKCEHEFENGACSLCGEIDPDYILPCNHNFENGACALCGEPCAHSFSDGICTACGSSDPDYIPPCNHNFANGACTLCGEPCAHSFSGESCTVCGAENPDFIPADNGESLYEDIVDDFKDLILYKYVWEELPKKPTNAPEYTDALYDVATLYDPSMEMGYAYKDIDGNGWLELILLGRDSRMYAMFTIADKAPALVRVFQNGMGYLAPDGTVFYNTRTTNDNIQTSETFITTLINGTLVGIGYGWTDTDGELNTNEDTVYHKTDADGTIATITVEEHRGLNSTYDYYWNYPSRLTKLSGLYFIPALAAQEPVDITADFSSYDAIIETFGLMHSTVAGGKYVRSYWTSSRYDTGMNFSSEDDFQIYNKLLGSCVLSQNSSTASFGYAIRDLNGDGTNELILLEAKFYVLAIFTLVDGSPVLLDNYTDLRVACIDSEGLIHVKERTIPGHKKNSEYFVYEIKNGELSAKIAIGVKHASDGTANAWYKIENGVAADISEADFNAYYAEYIADIGDSEFCDYTKNNSCLTFTAVGATEEE